MRSGVYKDARRMSISILFFGLYQRRTRMLLQAGEDGGA